MHPPKFMHTQHTNRILEAHEKKHFQVQTHASQANINTNVPKCSIKTRKEEKLLNFCAYTNQIWLCTTQFYIFNAKRG